MFEDQIQAPQEQGPQEKPKAEQPRPKPKVNLPEKSPYYYQPGELADEVMKEGGGKKKLIIIGLTIIILAGVSYGGYFLYNNFFGTEEDEAAVSNIDTSLNNANKNVNSSKNLNISNTNSYQLPGETELFIKAICYTYDNPSAIIYFAEGKIRDHMKQELSYVETNQECKIFTTEEINEVYELITTDGDNDGVNAVMEKVYSSDDSKKDTDGDSYDDLTEINNGYNPNGPGKMNET